uniref:Transmembrane protein n=1 Tax=Romanomermis culicivorax TaxID=13658 RepID=A0A915J4B6_ROMCU
MRTGSVASISRVPPHSTKIATAGVGGCGIARTGAVGMLSLATGVVVAASSMIRKFIGWKSYYNWCQTLRIDDRESESK